MSETTQRWLDSGAWCSVHEPWWPTVALWTFWLAVFAAFVWAVVVCMKAQRELWELESKVERGERRLRIWGRA